MKDDTNIWMLAALAAAGLVIWHQFSTQQLQTQLGNCQAEFRSFKDGVIYGGK